MDSAFHLEVTSAGSGLLRDSIPFALILVYDDPSTTKLEGAMYTLTSDLSMWELASRHAPALGASMLIAELFYKLSSFTLECLAFLATWYVLDAAVGAVIERLPRRQPLSSD